MQDINVYNQDDLNNEIEVVKEMNFFQRVLGVIVSPEDTMKNLSNKPRVLFPIIMIALTPAILLLLNLQGYKEYIKEMNLQTFTKMNIEATAEMLEKQANTSLIGGMVGGPIFSIGGWLLGTLILFGIIKIFGGQGRYKQYLSVTGYAYVIMVISSILTTIISYIIGSYNPEVSMTSLAILFSKDSVDSFIYTIFRQIEIFSIWHYVVIAIGVLVVSKVSKTKVYSIITAIYIIGMLIAAGMVKIGEYFMSAFGGNA